MYSDIFCKVYNEFGWNYYPEVFAWQLLLWLSRRGLAPKSALDLACGTGILCEELHASGIKVRGMDLSEGMIDIARKNAPDIRYDVGDMTTYCPEENFDLVTCTGDALNHIADLGDIEKIFRNVYRYTAPGGYFIFDLLDEGEISDSEPFETDFNENTRIWFQMTRPDHNKVNLCIRVFKDGVMTVEENIRETIHDSGKVCELLKKCGFTVEKCDHRLLEDRDPGTTWFVVARK